MDLLSFVRNSTRGGDSSNEDCFKLKKVRTDTINKLEDFGIGKSPWSNNDIEVGA